VDTYGERARAAAGLPSIDRIPGKHLPQEDQAPAITDRVAAIAALAGEGTPDGNSLGRHQLRG
jgi:hypothetical protein